MSEEKNFEAILSKIISLKEMINKAEQFKNKVRPDVYEKVMRDYSEQLNEYNSQMSGMGGEINVKIKNLDKDIEDLTKKIDSIQGQKEEIELRYMVGEMREDDYNQKINTLNSNKKQYDDSLIILSKSRNDFEELIKKFAKQDSFTKTFEAPYEPPKKSFQTDVDAEIEAKFDSKDDFLSETTFSFSDQEKIPEKEPEESEHEYVHSEVKTTETLAQDAFSGKIQTPTSDDFEPIKTVQSVTEELIKSKDSFDETFDSLFQEDDGDAVSEEESPEEEEEEELTSVMFEAQDDSENSIKCPKCGFENRPDAWNCEKCGSPIIL